MYTRLSIADLPALEVINPSEKIFPKAKEIKLIALITINLLMEITKTIESPKKYHAWP